MSGWFEDFTTSGYCQWHTVGGPRYIAKTILIRTDFVEFWPKRPSAIPDKNWGKMQIGQNLYPDKRRRRRGWESLGRLSRPKASLAKRCIGRPSWRTRAHDVWSSILYLRPATPSSGHPMRPDPTIRTHEAAKLGHLDNFAGTAGPRTSGQKPLL
jgi:hypothetical protein